MSNTGLTAGQNIPAPNEVNESCYEYLLAEILLHSSPPSEEASSSSGAIHFKLEPLGYDVGYRYTMHMQWRMMMLAISVNLD